MNIIFLSELANKALIEYMKTQGSVILVPKDERFDQRISSHPDLIISILDGNLVIDEHASLGIYQQLDAMGIPYVIGSSRLSREYPGDIAYNVVVTKDFLIHKLEDTNPLLSLHSRYTKKNLIPVKQGYTKCSTVVVDNHTLITGDPGIYQATKDHLNILLIQPGHVLLEGFDFGFLGGASGCIHDTVVFHGDLSKHPDFLRIQTFLEEAGKKLLYFPDFPLTDIGSILIYQHQENEDRAKSSHPKHVNIPIFISHEGCPHDCVFCNQRKITARPQAMTLKEVSEQVDLYSSTLDDRTYVELAFFGGSFTGIDDKLQESYLKLAYEYKRAGKIHGIRLSTRPDYISSDILDRLKRYEVDTIELGVQSLDEEVLMASNRGHRVSDVYEAVALIKEYGFRLGLQLMVGLPEDTKGRAVMSSKLTVLLGPDFVRIYPTLVIKETELLERSLQGEYHPLSLDEAVDWTKAMYQVFLQGRIPVIRMGLQPTELITEGKEVLYGPFHPAFRQLVEGAYFLELIQNKLGTEASALKDTTKIRILCNPKDLSQVIGHHRRNITELSKEYPSLKVISDERIKEMTVQCLIE